MVILFLILAIGAGVGTFIENDFGSAKAKELIYNSFWYQFTLLFSVINLIFVIIKTKMWRVKTRVLFHISFIIILIGAFTTHIFGIDGTMEIAEGEETNIILVENQKIGLPFSIKLNDFKLTRYSGSKSPSEFSSDVTVIDKVNGVEFQTIISMNNTLTYQGYKFFQTSYPNDEMGTELSVNKDAGVEITYFGYALLFLTIILNLFSKQSRFQFLIRKIKSMPIANLLLPLFLLFQTPAYSNETEYIEKYLKGHQENSKELAKAFGNLVVQGPTGRMKPLDTQNREVLNKLTQKDIWNGMSANQVILGIFSRPELWKKVNIIRVKTPKLKKLLAVSEKQRLVKFVDFFDDFGNYRLTDEVEKANQLVPSQRGTFERDLIKVDERLNILFMTYRGVLLTIFPLPNDKLNKWVDFKTFFAKVDNSKIKRSTSRLLDATYNRNYDKGLKYIEDISSYQKEFGNRIYPTQQKLDFELWFNETAMFFKLSISYLIFGLLLLAYGLISIFYNRLIDSKIKFLINIISFSLFAIHTFGIGLRWYIGGFTPISNTYETMIYIAYASIITSVIFLRKSTIALSSAFIMAGIFIFSAYLGEIDPEITNLVPVLKSYWLSIHVSVITASYGFFGVGAILGFITLLLFTVRKRVGSHIDTHIKNLTYINEVALLLGLVLLVVGNFLGGIWANESWGRYWGWDPKETWAYISILVYVMVLHIRLIKDIYSSYLFSVLSVLAFSSILMTYFGVNFYLAGMHSYATGDPVPIPEWVYFVSGIVLFIIIISHSNRNLKEKTDEKN